MVSETIIPSLNLGGGSTRQKIDFCLFLCYNNSIMKNERENDNGKEND